MVQGKWSQFGSMLFSDQVEILAVAKPKSMAVQSKELSGMSLDPVANDGIADFPGNGNTQTGFSYRVGGENDQETSTMNNRSGVGKMKKISSLSNPAFLRESIIGLDRFQCHSPGGCRRKPHPCPENNRLKPTGCRRAALRAISRWSKDP